MVLKFLKKRRARLNNNKNKKNNNNGDNKLFSQASRHSNHDETTSADDSFRSNGNSDGLLERYAREGRWDQFVKVTRSTTAEDLTTHAAASSSPEDVDDEIHHHVLHGVTTPLHLALHHRAPLTAVESLIDALHDRFEVPVPEECLDEVSRTPLHVAAESCCDEEVIRRLLRGPALIMPAVSRDGRGRTPLHAAAAGTPPVVSKRNFLGANPVQTMKWNKRRTILVLLEEYPEAVTVRDAAGRTPLQYAVHAGMRDSAVREMRRLHAQHAPEGGGSEDEEQASTVCPRLAAADVPLVVPSLTGSCRDFAALVSMDLERVLEQAPVAPRGQAHDDVSTIGDAEAELMHLESWEILE